VKTEDMCINLSEPRTRNIRVSSTINCVTLKTQPHNSTRHFAVSSIHSVAEKYCWITLAAIEIQSALL